MRKKGRTTQIGGKYFDKNLDDYGFFAKSNIALIPDEMLLSFVKKQIPKVRK